jgi:mono/diheme cytochrome c family protein
MTTYIKAGVLFVFIVVAALLFTFSTTSASVAAKEQAGPRSLYVQHCAVCHGSNGKAQTARGRKLEAADLTSADVQSMSTARIIRAITNGRVGMPSFKKKLSRQQIAQVAGYVQSF